MPRRVCVLDASALAFRYIPSENPGTDAVKRRLDELFKARAADPKSLDFQVPSICMAECSKAFARACFEKNLYGIGRSAAKGAYQKLVGDLLKDVSKDRIIHSLELERDHFIGIEEIYLRDYLELPRPNPRKKGRRLSPIDVLVISMARDFALNKAGGLENVLLVTAESRMEKICNEFPDDYPRVVNVWFRPVPLQ